MKTKRSKKPDAYAIFAAACTKLWPGMKREHQFMPKRRWRFDFAWPDRKVALEIEGGVWIRGRHTRGIGYERDCEKYSTAAAHGWRVLRATPRMVRRGDAIALLEIAMQTHIMSAQCHSSTGES